MRRDIDTLRLIVEFCDEIADDIQRFGTDIEDFLDDRAYQRSTTFSIEQIGELVKRLSSDLTEEFDDVDWHEIAKMRDFVAHRYQHVIQQLLWESMNSEVPALRARCAEIIADSHHRLRLGSATSPSYSYIERVHDCVHIDAIAHIRTRRTAASHAGTRGRPRSRCAPCTHPGSSH